MKQLLKLCSFISLAGLALASCETPSDSANKAPQFQMTNPHGGGGSTPANPELCYIGETVSKGKTYQTLMVMDVDGTHATQVYRAPKPSPMILYGSPTWSADGGSIVFTQSITGGTAPDTIKAIDISVNGSGQAVGSNLRTITIAPAGSVFKNAFWCSASAGLIAYTSNETNTNSLWTVSTSGGSPTKIMTINKTWAGHTNPLGTPTWNGDDSRLALVRLGANSTTIMIYNTTTWAYEDSITVAGSINGLEWSRSGLDKLAFSANNKIYYVDPVTGAVPTTNNVVGGFPAWAPDNSSMMYTASTTTAGRGEVRNNTAFTATTSLVSSTIVTAAKWK